MGGSPQTQPRERINHDSGGRILLGESTIATAYCAICDRTIRCLESHFTRIPMASAMGYLRSPHTGNAVTNIYEVKPNSEPFWR